MNGTSHPAIPGSSVTSRPCVKIGLTVIWKYGGSAKHNRIRPRYGQSRRNLTPTRTLRMNMKNDWSQNTYIHKANSSTPHNDAKDNIQFAHDANHDIKDANTANQYEEEQNSYKERTQWQTRTLKKESFRNTIWLTIELYRGKWKSNYSQDSRISIAHNINDHTSRKTY